MPRPPEVESRNFGPQGIPGLVYDSPNVFSAKERVLLGIVPPLAAMSFRLLFGSCRKEDRGIDHCGEVLRTHGRAIVAFWHESMALAIHFYRGTGSHTLTSYSYDGDLAARVVRQFGCWAVRGSSSRGGSDALKGLAEALDHIQIAGITLDGPRGPRRVAKPGAAILAARTGTPIIPQAFHVRPAVRLHSWDRFPVPFPFARRVTVYGQAIPPPADTSEEAIEAVRKRVENELNALHTALEKEFGVEGVR